MVGSKFGVGDEFDLPSRSPTRMKVRPTAKALKRHAAARFAGVGTHV
jgi:hypothetical protein